VEEKTTRLFERGSGREILRFQETVPSTSWSWLPHAGEASMMTQNCISRRRTWLACLPTLARKNPPCANSRVRTSPMLRPPVSCAGHTGADIPDVRLCGLLVVCLHGSSTGSQYQAQGRTPRRMRATTGAVSITSSPDFSCWNDIRIKEPRGEPKTNEGSTSRRPRGQTVFKMLDMPTSRRCIRQQQQERRRAWAGRWCGEDAKWKAGKDRKATLAKMTQAKHKKQEKNLYDEEE